MVWMDLDGFESLPGDSISASSRLGPPLIPIRWLNQPTVVSYRATRSNKGNGNDERNEWTKIECNFKQT